MIEALTGAFSGAVCALIVAAFRFAFSKSKQLDFWVLIVGAFIGLIAVQLGATFLGWQEWFFTVVALALFEYGGKAVYVRSKRKLVGQVHVDKRTVLKWAFIVGSVVFVEWFIIALFMWFLPFALGDKFMVWDIEYDKPIFRWFAMSVPQIDRDAFVAYLIFGVPTFCVIVGSSFGFAISHLVRKFEGRWRVF